MIYKSRTERRINTSVLKRVIEQTQLLNLILGIITKNFDHIYITILRREDDNLELLIVKDIPK